ncbi:phage repressor protein [Brevibacillus porteri]|uniref:Phage repressor protein n=2 Tax=Brevibacillus porteri TaxID=2126350 RepID=A0ABX5FHL0_9BACL|nr:phage repressor protein [Brevibacillus porteri]
MNMRVESWMGHSIRFVETTPGDWVGIAKDVADALRYSDTNAMTRHLNKKYLTTVKLTGMNQNFTAISEQGIYKAVTRSQRPEAEEFEDWIFEMLKQLRKSTGLEGFQIFRMLDKDHQKEAMSRLKASLSQPVKVDFIKANTIANKTTSSLNGHPKMIKKDQMTPKMLVQRQEILDDTVNLMSVKEKFGLDLSVSKSIYGKYLHMRTKQAQ